MIVNEFNEKYKDYLEEGHYGLDVHDKDFIEWLDKKFEEFIKEPLFKYSQIKEKFWMGRFYCDGLSEIQVKEVENKIEELYK